MCCSYSLEHTVEFFFEVKNTVLYYEAKSSLRVEEPAMAFNCILVSISSALRYWEIPHQLFIMNQSMLSSGLKVGNEEARE